jgi:hypothetical protein
MERAFKTHSVLTIASRHSAQQLSPLGRTTTKNIWRNGPFIVSEKETSQNGGWR